MQSDSRGMHDSSCRCYEQAMYEESPIGEALRAHVATCPRCSALATAAALFAPRMSASPDDALTPRLRALAAEAAARHRDRRARRRWLAPALIGASTYLFTICVWLVLVAQGPASPGPAAPPAPSAGFALPSLPVPSPLAVGGVLVACLLWIAATVVMARRRGEAAA